MIRFKMGLCASALVATMAMTGGAEAFPAFGAAPLAAADTPLTQVQYYGGGRCFYPDGWHGPGFYRCGFRFRRGLGFLGGGGGGFHGGGRGFGGGGGHFGGGGRGFGGGGHGGGGHGGGGHGGGGHGGGGHGGGGHGGGHH